MGIERDSTELSRQIVLTVFLESGASAKELAATQSDLKTIAGVDSITVQSANTVKEAFVSRFATSIGAVLPDNAFPTAMIVSLKEEYRTKERIDSIVSQALGMQSVGNVSYRTAYVEAVEKRQIQEYAAFWVIAGICMMSITTLLWQAVSRAGLSLQKSAGAILGGVAAAMFVGVVLFVNMKHLFPWLDSAGWGMLLKVQLLGSVFVCAFATLILAITAVRQATYHDNTAHPTSDDGQTIPPDNSFKASSNESLNGGNNEQ